ncbi:hypothetical protein [Rhizobium leguminosarum]|uniref:hypothetical protein n=1 Tax=Rhizobium leguminosarum TaxID=384 RepID=UPI0004840CB2|nr:hypothetical protein [Rhizobium leguminosarum]WFT88401.1 hypothetical protein QA638_12695 [Rhizobium leguminosarum]
MGLSFSGILDIAISLIFLYLLISLVCTSLCESIATLLKLRSRSLSVGVAKILENRDLIDRFYANGLVKGAISASQWKNAPVEGVPTKYGHSSYMDSRSFAMALLASLNPDKPVPGVADIEENLKAANLPSGIKDVLSAALTTGVKDMTALRDEVASWFDSAMDRLSGEYKRQLKWISFGVGLFIAILLNVDSVDVATRLWKDQALRQQLASAAETYVNGKQVSCPVGSGQKSGGAPAKQDAASTPPKQDSGGQTPAADGAVGGGGPTPEDVGKQVVLELNCQLRTMNDALSAARPFPIGWTTATPVDGDKDTSRNFPAILHDTPLMFSKIIGWLFTAVALSLGAPFWFDTLSKFMNVRGAGEKPKKVQVN